jgi:hypothetical protein
MQGFYKHIPETNHVPREYIVTAILSLLFMMPISPVPIIIIIIIYYYFLIIIIISVIVKMCLPLNTVIVIKAFGILQQLKLLHKPYGMHKINLILIRRNRRRPKENRGGNVLSIGNSPTKINPPTFCVSLFATNTATSPSS